MRAETPHPQPLKDLPQLLGKALSAERLTLLHAIAAYARHNGSRVYLVGGVLRDLLLGRPSPDLDLVVEGDATALAAGLAQRYGGQVLQHRRFGTAKWALENGEALDLITARGESYTRPGALPTVQPGTIAEDLARRDFTINAIAMRLEGGQSSEILDPWQGYSDLQAGLVRVLHPRSFIDDPTRILRAARFAARFSYQLELQTLNLIPAALSVLKALSGKRLRHELDLILSEPSAPQALNLLQAWGVLGVIHPSLAWTEANARRWESAKADNLALPQRYALWLMDGERPALEEISQRLSFSKLTERTVQEAALLARLGPDLLAGPPSQRFARLAPYGLPSLELLHLLQEPGGQSEAWQRYLEHERNFKINSTGATLQAKGLAPGPRYHQILGRLRAAWLDGEITDTAGEEALLDRLIQGGQ